MSADATAPALVSSLPKLSDPLPGFPSLPSLFGGMVGPVGSPEEQAKINQILGLPSGTNSAVGSLLLGPIVRGTTVVMP
jgi:hypothetical protein